MCDVILLLSQSCGVELTCLGEIRHVDADAPALPSVLLLLTLTQNVCISSKLIFLYACINCKIMRLRFLVFFVFHSGEKFAVISL